MAEELRNLDIVRLKMWHKRERTPTAYEQSFVRAARELERLRAAMGVSRSCVERALALFKQAADAELVRGRSVEAMAAAALYMACRMLDTPLSLAELSVWTANDKIAEYYRLMVRKLGVKLPASGPELYLRGIADRLMLSDDVVRTAAEILRKAREARVIVGRDPAGIAAAAVYAAIVLHKVPILQKDVALAVGVTTTTIRNRYRQLLEIYKTS